MPFKGYLKDYLNGLCAYSTHWNVLLQKNCRGIAVPLQRYCSATAIIIHLACLYFALISLHLQIRFITLASYLEHNHHDDIFCNKKVSQQITIRHNKYTLLDYINILLSHHYINFATLKKLGVLHLSMRLRLHPLNLYG